mgnify:CR=1 FL=1
MIAVARRNALAKQLSTVEVLARVDVLCLDSSHAHSRGVLDAVARVKSDYPDTPLIVGNVATELLPSQEIVIGIMCSGIFST